jgi:RHS repeat-associated protein
MTHCIWGLDVSGSHQGAGSVGGLLAVIHGDNVYNSAFDGNGNITEYISADGTLVAHYEYSPFGETVIQSGDMAEAFAFRFSTKYYNAEAGLYYYGYRYYSPDFGRWISPDPLCDHTFLTQAMRAKSMSHRRELFKASLGPRYVFVSNEPLSLIDPLGLFDWPWPANSRVCNNSSDQCLIVWDDKTGHSLLKPGECTSRWRDRGDYAYWNGHWFRCRGGMRCSIDDRPIAEYPNSPNYLPPVEEGGMKPRPPEIDLCRQYCDCNANSSRNGEMNDQCDCLDKCMGRPY